MEASTLSIAAVCDREGDDSFAEGGSGAKAYLNAGAFKRSVVVSLEALSAFASEGLSVITARRISRPRPTRSRRTTSKSDDVVVDDVDDDRVSSLTDA